jgi:hypothetical protein
VLLLLEGDSVGYAFVTIKDESSDRVYHLSCFEACTTGSRRDGDVWTYRIVDMPTKDER